MKINTGMLFDIFAAFQSLCFSEKPAHLTVEKNTAVHFIMNIKLS
jgi:hypothetical protein